MESTENNNPIQTQPTTPLPTQHRQQEQQPQQQAQPQLQPQRQYTPSVGGTEARPVFTGQSQYPQVNRALPSQQRQYVAQPNPYAPYPYSPATQPKNYGHPNAPYSSFQQTSPQQTWQTPPTQPQQKSALSTGIFTLIAVIALFVGGLAGAGIMYGIQNEDSQAQPEGGNSWDAEPDYGNGVYGEDGSDPYFPESVEGDSSGSRVKSAPGVLIINSILTGGIGAGSGMVISSDGYAVTNYHVVEGSTTVRVTVADTKETYNATVLGHDATVDIALLKLENAKHLDYVKFDTTSPKTGTNVSILGNANGQGYLSQLQGKITATNQDITAMGEGTGSEHLTGLIKTDADVVQGYSGGPMFNKSGKVIGVIVAASSAFGRSGDTDGYAIPAKSAMKIVDQIKTGKSQGTTIVGSNAALGVTVTSEGLGNSKNNSGATVVQVTNGSAAEEAGIRAGDVITSVDDKSINSASDLSKLIKTYDVGDKVKVTYSDSSGKKKTIEVKLGESPVN